MTLMRVTAVDYTTIDSESGPPVPEPVIKLVGRDENGERRVHHVYGTRPYLYVQQDERIPEEHTHRVLQTIHGYAATDPREQYNGTELKRLECRVPDDVKAIADDLEETWESDIPFYRRASIDYDLSGYVRLPDRREVDIDEIKTDVDVPAEDSIDPRIVYGDIEVLMSDDPIDVMLEEADSPVTAITLYDNYEDQYDIYALNPDDDVGVSGEVVKTHLEENGFDTDEEDVVIHRCPDEIVLLDSFLGYFEERRPDLTTGWNWVNFDVLYLLRRLKRLHTDDNNLDINRLSDAGGTKQNFSDYHGDLARAAIGVPAVDLLKLFRERIEFSQWRSWSLDYVAQEVVGRGKVDDVNVNHGFRNERGKLAAYNLIDVELCVRIDEQREIIETCMGLAEESQIQIYDVFSEMRLVDGYIMARSDDDEILPPQSESDVPNNAGGLVLEAADGISEWVGVMDLKSLYPSAMITWNISPETVHWADDGKMPEGDFAPDYLKVPWVPEASEVTYPVTEEQVSWDRLWTNIEEEGLVPKYLKLLFENREEAKARRAEYDEDSPGYVTWDRKQYGLKVLMNSFYGVSSNNYWRLAKHGLGDAITSASRYALFKGKQLVERNGYEVIYGDTDSCFFGLDREGMLADEEEQQAQAISDGVELTEQINDGMEEAIRDAGLEGEHPYLDGTLPHDKGSHCLHYEFEKLYRRYIQFGKKKRYAGLIRWKEGKEVSSIDITGFEARRSDTPEIAARAQEEVLRKVLDGQDFESVSEYVSGLCDDINEGAVPLPEMARPKSLGKALDDYAHPTQTVKACRASEDQLDKTWLKGDDPFLVFLSDTPAMMPGVSVIALEWSDDLPDGYEIDTEEHIRICLKSPLEPITDELGWDWKEIKTGTQAGSALDGDWGDSEVTVASAGQKHGEDASSEAEVERGEVSGGQGEKQTAGRGGDGKSQSSASPSESGSEEAESPNPNSKDGIMGADW